MEDIDTKCKNQERRDGFSSALNQLKNLRLLVIGVVVKLAGQR